MFTVDECKTILQILDENIPEQKELKEKIQETLNDAENEKNCVWYFLWDGNYGNVEGIFKATKEEVENAIGKEVSFGEILGKHSEVYGTINEGDIKLITDNPIEVARYKTFGYDPLEYLENE